MTLSPKHWAVIAGQLIALGTMIGGLQHGWHDASSPMFISGLMIQIGTLIGALSTEAVDNKRGAVWSDTERAVHRGELGV